MEGDRLPDGWQWSTLGDVADPRPRAIVSGPFGSNIGSRFFVEHGVPVIRGNNLTTDFTRFVDDGFVFVTEEKATELRNCEAIADDLVFTAAGSLGQVGLIPKTAKFSRYIISNKQLRARLDTRKVDPLFAFYWFCSDQMVEYVQQRNTGSSVPLINLGVLRSLPVPLPPVAEQRAIVRTLGALDDKIELNRRTNETLEAIARTLFETWFVDLNPVRSKVADLIRAGVLEIGDGYRAKNSEMGEPGLPFIRAGDLNSGFDTSGADVLSEASVAKAGTKISRTGDVAFTSKGTIGRFARVTEFTEPFVYSPQVCFWRTLDRHRLHPAILYCWMQSDNLKAQIEAVAGQTDMAPYVSLRDQREMVMPIFPESQHTIGRQIDSLLARQALGAMETRSLAALRDALLPKLISGELRVKDAERIVADAV